MKFLLSTFLFVFAISASFAQLATNSYWTTTIPTRYLPTGAVVPSDAEIDSMIALADVSDVYSINFDINLPGTLDNADEAAAFDAVGDALHAEILATYAVGEWGLDTSLVNLWGKTILTDVRRRHSTFEPNDLPMQYTVAGDIFKCVGKFIYTKF